MTVVWVLDRETDEGACGDVRLFSTKEAAKAASGSQDEEWMPDGPLGAWGRLPGSSIAVVYPLLVDVPEPSADDWPEPMRSQVIEYEERQAREKAEREARSLQHVRENFHYKRRGNAVVLRPNG